MWRRRPQRREHGAVAAHGHYEVTVLERPGGGHVRAAGGPVLAAGTAAFVCTPLAMHGGSAPPLVVPGDAVVTVEVRPGYAGFDVEIDGRERKGEARRFSLALHADKLTLVTFETSGRGLTGLRKRGLITDSPRVLARDARKARKAR